MIESKIKKNGNHQSFSNFIGLPTFKVMTTSLKRTHMTAAHIDAAKVRNGLLIKLS